MSETIYSEYFQIAKDASQKYGNKTVLLMQVGAFLEIYGLAPSSQLPQYKYTIFDVCQICDLNVSEKKMTHEGSAIYMAGFRDFTMEKYIQRLVNASYNVVVYLQEKNEKNTRRIFHAVYSPGTYLPFEADNATITLTNNIMCIWIDVFVPLLKPTTNNRPNIHKNMVYGVAVSNIYTGKSAMFEHENQFAMTTTAFDELERIISVYNPSEVILCSELEVAQINQIIQYSGIKTSNIHYVNTQNDEKALNCMKQTYVQTILSNQFGEDTYFLCGEFSQYPIATQSYCFLLNFVKEHNPNLVRNICLPVFENTSVRTILANHTLKQLNIINDESGDGNQAGILSSVSSFLNKCCSHMGRRQFYSGIVHPVFDEEWLNKEYEIVDYMLKKEHYAVIPNIRKSLQSVCDIEKSVRQLISRRIYPNVIHKLYKSMETLQQLNVCFYEMGPLIHYLCDGLNMPNGNLASRYSHFETILEKIKNVMDTHLLIDVCAEYNNLNGLDEPFICPGVSPKLDELVNKKREDHDKMMKIHKWLNDIIRNKEHNHSLEHVKIHETEKSGVALQITKTRAKSLKQYLDDYFKVSVEAQIAPKIVIRHSDITFKSLNNNTDEIRITQFNSLSSQILEMKSRIQEVVLLEYQRFLQIFETECVSELECVSKYASRLDILQSKTYVAHEYKYVRPTIQTASSTNSGGSGSVAPKSFVIAKGLRHCLIEQLQMSELYVDNDISLGAEGAHDGILLYGTNAVGKTSIIRALGIAIILAQSGMFVPCSEFIYKPYQSIFSRILGNDNIFKGLSTFAVEMNELRMILNMANENSLILGDELCSGTENESALSIFMSGLIDLHEKRSSFIFATHFHEIIQFEEMNQLPKIALKHMAVFYDREKDCLVYDRKLLDGAGNRMYGLEVCKSLHLPLTFLERAYNIRNKYFPNTKGELQNEPSKYHSRKIKGICEKHLADENGFIGHFHKNHPANLMVLCENCHLSVHHNTPPSSPQYSNNTVNMSSRNAETVSAVLYSTPNNTSNKKVAKRKTTSGKMTIL